MDGPSKKGSLLHYLPVLFILTGFAALCILLKTSPGKLIGAAFCHQIPSRSPSPDFPFCYRCAGLFCGTFFGGIYSGLFRKKSRIFSWQEILFFLIAFLLFLTDAANKASFIPFHWYPDQACTRFLTAFPLGFALAALLIPVFLQFFVSEINTGRSHSLVWEILFMCAGCLISLLLVFQMGRFGIRAARFLTLFGSLGFLFILYCILVKCVGMVMQKEYSSRTVYRTAAILALLQVCLLGGAHLAVIHFVLPG